MLFSDILGNEKIKDILLSSIDTGHIGHAYIFEGMRGVGRLSMARAFASALVCGGKGKSLPCGKCKACILSKSDNHPDIRIVTNKLYNESKSSPSILVDTIRSMKKEIYIKPYVADRKIYIIPNADTMNISAQNSLLKVLEEPPAYCTIILIAENASLFLPTILSRVVTLKFHALSYNLIEKYLHDKYGDKSQVEITINARMSDGSIGKAIELLSDNEAGELRNEVISKLMLLTRREYVNLYNFIKLLKNNRAEIKFILNVLKSWFRDALLMKQANIHDGIINIDQSDNLKKFCSKITKETAVRFVDTTLKHSKHIDQNANYAIAVQCMAIEYWEEIHD